MSVMIVPAANPVRDRLTDDQPCRVRGREQGRRGRSDGGNAKCRVAVP